MLQPPPYTPRTEPTLLAASAKTKTTFLRHFVIVILAFTYDVDFDKLRKALTASPLPLVPSTLASVPLLSPNDMNYLLELANTIITCGESVHHNHISLIKDAQRALLVGAIMTPATALGISPERIMYHLRFFPRHKLDARMRRLSCLYADRSRGLGWWKTWQRENLAKGLVCDDLLIERVAPSEEVRVLLGEAVARFRKKECFGVKRWERLWWAPVMDKALVEELGRKKVGFGA
jgi:hypothetical protein